MIATSATSQNWENKPWLVQAGLFQVPASQVGAWLPFVVYLNHIQWVANNALWDCTGVVSSKWAGHSWLIFCGFPSSRMWTRNSRQKHRNYWPIINSLQPRNYLYPLDARAEKQQLCCYHDTWRYSKTPYILVENVTPLWHYTKS
jgi:hypothetical protein